MERTLALDTVHKVGEKVTLKGWVDVKRDHGKLTFIDVRDQSGKVQSVGFEKMGELTPESVIEITGTVRQRPENLVNPKIPTGTVEVDVESYTVLNKAATLPIPIHGDGKELSEETRLRYRYLDLRRERMRQIIKLRSDFFFELRKSLKDNQFTEVETPILSKATMEGARDFLVPSRFQPGKFYALPQAPQQYKQLLMTAGIYRYFQFARCFRDEDLRADRGFEFTQLDLELSYATRDEVMDAVNSIVAQSVKAVGGKLQQEKFPVFTYKEAMERFGADKFDLRSDAEKTDGTLAYAWVVDFPMFKKVNREDAAEIRDSKSGWTFTHNPFSAPKAEFMEWHQKGEHIDEILAEQYDLVCNGYEVGGGSIRAHNPEVLKATYRIMGYDGAATEASIGHMLEAFSYGAPPHGGIALGMDRQVMLLAGEDSLKETIAFPMTSTGRTAIMDAPNAVTEQQLAELGLKVLKKTFTTPHDHILDLLKTNEVDFKEQRHEPMRTTEDAVRLHSGISLHQVAKSLVLQADDDFILHVVPGDRRADLEAVKTALNAKRVAMASKESVLKKTGLAVGSIPPFGSVIGMKTVVDASLSDNPEIIFSAGREDCSVRMRYDDFVRIEKPVILKT